MGDLENQVEDIFNKVDPSRWELVEFGDVVREVRDVVKHNQGVLDFRVVGLEHLTPDDIHIRSWDTPGTETTFTKRFAKGHVLFGRRRAYQRKAGIAEFDGICSGDIIVMEAKDRLDPSLLPFLVHGDRFFKWAISTSAGSLSPRTKFKDLAKFELRLPPLPIQKRLAELLWAIDSLMQDAYSVRSRLEICRIVFLKKEFVSTPGSFRKIADFARVRAGYGFPHEHQGESKGAFPFVKVSDMNNCLKYAERSANYIEQSVLSLLKAKLFEPNTIIFPKVGAAVYTNKKRLLSKPSLIDNNVMGVTVYDDNVFPEYVYYYFLSLDLGKIATKGALPAISAGQILSLKIPDRPVEHQRTIVNSFNSIDSSVLVIDNYIDKLMNMRQSVLKIIV